MVSETFQRNSKQLRQTGAQLFDKYHMTETSYLEHVEDPQEPCDPLSCHILATVFSTHVLILFGENLCWTSAVDFDALSSKNALYLGYIGNNEFIFLRDLDWSSPIHSGLDIK